MIAAVLQMNSGPDQAANLRQARDLLARAAAQGAGLAVLPEHFGLLLPEGQAPAAAETLAGPTVAFLQKLARQHHLWLVGGSFAQRGGRGRLYNTSVLIDDQGRPRAHYQKIHLFDLGLPGQPALTESRYYSPGRRLVVAPTPLGRLGMSVCFDLRFPELYRRLRLQGAEILVAPSAFTAATGREHWELLVRARALENQCYMLAAAQWGEHAPGRASHGQAMIVDPWGRVLAQCEPGIGLVWAEIRPQRVARVRGLLDTASLARLLPAAWQRGGV
ncbi:MAG: carbon-nitrogen hydrolase family protein [Pseudomonadota bacterium]